MGRIFADSGGYYLATCEFDFHIGASKTHTVFWFYIKKDNTFGRRLSIVKMFAPSRRCINHVWPLLGCAVLHTFDAYLNEDQVSISFDLK